VCLSGLIKQRRPPPLATGLQQMAAIFNTTVRESGLFFNGQFSVSSFGEFCR